MSEQLPSDLLSRLKALDQEVRNWTEWNSDFDLEVIAEAVIEIERLREFEWRYKELCK